MMKHYTHFVRETKQRDEEKGMTAAPKESSPTEGAISEHAKCYFSIIHYQKSFRYVKQHFDRLLNVLLNIL